MDWPKLDWPKLAKTGLAKVGLFRLGLRVVCGSGFRVLDILKGQGSGRQRGPKKSQNVTRGIIWTDSRPEKRSKPEEKWVWLGPRKGQNVLTGKTALVQNYPTKTHLGQGTTGNWRGGARDDP